MIGRRRVLGFLASSPLAAKAAADEMAGKLAGVAPHGLGQGIDVPSSGQTEPQKDAIARALKIPGNRQQVLDMLWEDAEVRSIDPDLAVLRSFSLNAKITFQRQRNVERRYQRLTEDWPWRRLEAFLKKITLPF